MKVPAVAHRVNGETPDDMMRRGGRLIFGTSGMCLYSIRKGCVRDSVGAGQFGQSGPVISANLSLSSKKSACVDRFLRLKLRATKFSNPLHHTDWQRWHAEPRGEGRLQPQWLRPPDLSQQPESRDVAKGTQPLSV